MALTVGSGSYQFAQTVTLNPANVAANSVATEAFTITGIRTDTMYHVDALSLEAGLFVLQAIPTATNQLTFVFFNPTNADINAASQVFRIVGL